MTQWLTPISSSGESDSSILRGSRMLEVRYIKDTGVITAWAGSPEFTGGHLEPKDGEEIIVIDCPNPEYNSSQYLIVNDQLELQPLLPPPEPNPDTLRAQEILSNPNIPIPATDLADLVRIFGRRLGYDF